MRTTILTLALITLPLALGACSDQSFQADDELGDDPAAGAEAGDMVRVTVLDFDESGEQTAKVSLLSRAQVKELEAQRSGAQAGGSAAPQKHGEDVGTTQQALSVRTGTSNCMAKGLLIYSGYSLTGDILCLITAGHEAAGTAGFSLPADWRLENGGRYPKSFWSGDDSGRFAAYFTTLSFAPWTIVNSAPSPVVEAVYVYMHRTLDAPAADPSIAPPAGYPLVHKMAAKGHQIYVCKDVSGGLGVFGWILSAPSALLMDTHSPGDILGWHYAGPYWRSADDGSSIKAAKVAEVASPDPNAIAWLKLEVTEHAGAGLFSPVAFVQRVNTVGGKPPGPSCFQPNQTVWVDYTADYYFYAAPTAPTGWACPLGYYNSNDGCDCQCGMPDPDCARLDQTQYGCYGGQVCNQSGQCVAP
jgi:hypothetical protein